MSLNWIGLVAALATFGGVWIGHVSVRKIEAMSPTVWAPSAVALFLGLSLEFGALLSENLYVSAALGILGILSCGTRWSSGGSTAGSLKAMRLPTRITRVISVY
jgi:hypothetical protein